MKDINHNDKLRYKGFTLIELVVTIVIIGILASMALPMYQKVVEKSRVPEALTTLRAIYDSQMREALETDAYAANPGDLDINFTDHYYAFALDNADFSNGIQPTEVIATAARIGGPYAYTIEMREDGKFNCSAACPPADSGINLPE